MYDEISNENKSDFTLLNKNIKYPTYPDEEFQNSILDNPELNNYSSENTKLAFKDFFQFFKNCKTSTNEIIERNTHKIQQYFLGINEKAMNYIFYFYLLDKFAILVEKKYFKEDLTELLQKDLFYDDMIYDCTHLSENFSALYKSEFKEPNEIAQMTKTFTPIIERYKKLLQNKNEIGNIIIRTIKYLTKYLFKPLHEELNKFKKIEIFHVDNYFKTKINEENEIILLNVILYLKKLEFLDLFFYNSAILDKNDINNLDEKSIEWENLQNTLFRVVPKNAEEIKNKISEMKNNPHLGNSILSNIQAENSATSIIFSSIKNYFYYKANENKTLIDSKKYQIKNTVENTRELFGLIKKFKYVISKIMPSIGFRRKIYVKKEFPPVTRMYINKLINFMKGQILPVNSNHSNYNLEEDSLPIIFRDKVPDKELKRKYVSVTILNKEKLYFKDEKKENMFSSVVKLFKKNEPDKQVENNFRNNAIIISVHGGGFISGSTFLEEIFLRNLSKDLNVPIFGINYSLSPEYQYPEALNDIYQAYMWILNHAKEELNMDIKHIILTGESAGASLILGLNNLLIAIKEYDLKIGENIIFPELIMANYPVTYINYKNISNTLILSLNEPMLSINAISYIYKSYVGNYEIEDQDPFLNPAKVNDFILDRTKCKIRFMFGTEDVFREDGIRMLHLFDKYNRKEKNKNFIDSKGYDLIYFGHGFNGFSKEIQQIGRNVIIPEVETFLNNIK